MAKDGYYLCKRCKGRGSYTVTEDIPGNWGIANQYIEDCPSCDGTGQVYYRSGLPEKEYLARINKPMGYYPESCFPYATLVETPFGKVPIGELAKDQVVLSYQGTGILVPRRITRVLKYDVSSIVRVEFTHDEAYLKCTKSHSFLTGRGWLSVKNLHSGDSIFRASSSQIQKAVIKSIIPTGVMEPVFNLYTEGEHNFLVDGYIAHNFTHFRLLRTAFHKLFIDDSPKELLAHC